MLFSNACERDGIRRKFVYGVTGVPKKTCSLCVLCVELVVSQSTGINELGSVGSERFIITACQETAGSSRLVFSQGFCLNPESYAFQLIHGIVSVGAGLCGEGLVSLCSVLQAGKGTSPG